jgi:hypothetical protein
MCMMEPETLVKLEAMAARLCGGSDKMRDEGNLLWLLVWTEVVEVELPDPDKEDA